MKTKALSFCVLFFLTSILIFAGGQKEEGVKPEEVAGKVTITMMVQESEYPKELRDQFESENPGIKLIQITLDSARANTMLAAGNPPDLWRTTAPSFSLFCRKGIFKDLTPYFKKSKVLNLDDLDPVNNYYKWDGKTQGKGGQYGMVKDWSLDFMIFYNKDAYDEAGLAYPSDEKPLTGDEFKTNILKTTKIEGSKIIRYGLSVYPFSNNPGRPFSYMLATQGKDLYTADSMLTDDPALKEAAKWYFDLAKNHALPNPLDPCADWDGAIFQAGRIAHFWGGFWFGASVKQSMDTNRIGFAPGPMFGNKRVNFCTSAAGYCIPVHTKNIDAAWKLFESYNAGPAAVDRAKSGWGFPSLKSLYKFVPKETPFDKYLYEQIIKESKYAINNKFSPYIEERTIPGIYNREYEQVLRGNIPFDEFFQRFVEGLNEIISESKGF